MKKLIWLILLLSFCATAQTSPYKEIYEKPFFKGTYPQKIPVLFRLYPVYQSNDMFDVYVPVEIGYNYLQFLREGDTYYAEVEIELAIKRQGEDESRLKVFRTSITAQDFDATNSRTRFHSAMDSLRLPAGSYQIAMKYRDLNGSRRLSSEQRLTLKSPGPLYSSPPLFVDSNDESHSLLPEVKGLPSPIQIHWDFNRNLSFFLQIHREDSSMAVPAYVELLDAEEGNILHRVDTVLTNQHSKEYLQIDIPASKLKEGAHRLKTVYKFADDSLRKILPFQIVWFDKPVSLWDYQLAVQPLQHIIDSKDYKELIKGNNEEKRRKLRNFWEERDPTNGTPYNELKKEFYTRVDSAIIKYSNRRTLGWKTDPGMIYISMGPPDKVEDKSLAPVTPYMRWTYILDDKQMTYTFRAMDGRKEYELTDSEESAL